MAAHAARAATVSSRERRSLPDAGTLGVDMAAGWIAAMRKCMTSASKTGLVGGQGCAGEGVGVGPVQTGCLSSVVGVKLRMTQIAAITKISHHKHDWVCLACQQRPAGQTPHGFTTPPSGLGGRERERKGWMEGPQWSDAAAPQSISTTILQGSEQQRRMRRKMNTQQAGSPSNSLTFT